MATQLLAAGTTAANSSSFTLADGESASVAMKGALQSASIIVEMQDDAAAWNAVGYLTAAEPGKIITGPGTFRVRRQANSPSVGVFRG
ncbi:hypothetical protein [Devosia sp. Naph2]|uniref:hypothetical protein n=1 Tax=Devosia polycyclovorans TaxID=3345148 RepID=UPI0035CED851